MKTLLLTLAVQPMPKTAGSAEEDVYDGSAYCVPKPLQYE
jgi:hypothetical protein